MFQGIPECTRLSSPLNNDTNVPVDTDLSWNPVTGATGYQIFIRSTEDENTYALYSAENTTTYNLPFDLPEYRQIYVIIYPYSSNGDLVAEGCIEETFTTGQAISPPICTTLVEPLGNAINVSIATNITWTKVEGASGYEITIKDENRILNAPFRVENVLSYDLSFDLPYNKTINVLIVPFNSAGEAMGCLTESFTTEKEKLLLPPPKYFTPNNDGFNDFWIVPNQFSKIDCVYIYDQYGRLIKSLALAQEGWDGTYAGNELPSSDYWYLIKYKNGQVLRGHFSLIR